MTRADDGRDAPPRGREDVVFRPLSDEWVLYDPRTHDLHVLNASAAAIWVCCDGTMGPAGIAREVAERLEGAPDLPEVERDVRETLERFREDGLLE